MAIRFFDMFAGIGGFRSGLEAVTELTEDRYEPQETRRVTVVSGQTATVTFNNKLKRGDLTVAVVVVSRLIPSRITKASPISAGLAGSRRWTRSCSLPRLSVNKIILYPSHGEACLVYGFSFH